MDWDILSWGQYIAGWHNAFFGTEIPAAIVIGFQTNTFNAAALAQMTIQMASLCRIAEGYSEITNYESFVKAYLTENDFLDFVQWPLSMSALGQRIILQDENWIPAVEAHSMPQVFYGLMYRYNYEI